MKEEIIKILNDNDNRIDIGLTHIILFDNVLIIEHNGNMGNSIEQSVNPNLNKCGLPSIDKLKTIFRLYYEEGSPDYLYIIKFKM